MAFSTAIWSTANFLKYKKPRLIRGAVFCFFGYAVSHNIEMLFMSAESACTSYSGC